MLFPSKKATGHSSLLVPDKETVTLDKDQKGLSILTLRPRSVAALLVLCGMPPKSPPRLSDGTAFETVESSDGLIEISHNDRMRRVGGHSPHFIRSILRTLDPLVPMPRSVRLPVIANRDANVPMKSISSKQQVSEQQVPVPDFLQNLAVMVNVVVLEDIVIGFGGTLVINYSPITVNNFLAYGGSRVQQITPWGLIMDVAGTMRGGIPSIVHNVVNNSVVIDWNRLGQLAVVGL
jgi:hypothetical protein